MKRIVICMVVLCLGQWSMYGQKNDKGLLSPIELKFDEGANKAYISIIMDGDMTVFKASKLHNVPVAAILKANNIKDASQIEKGRELSLPFDMETIFKATSLQGTKNTKFAPVVYVVKPKETLYKIAKVYARQSVEEMKTRNGLSSSSIEVGQKLIIGWLPIDSKHKVNFASQADKIEKVQADKVEKVQAIKVEKDAKIEADKVIEGAKFTKIIEPKSDSTEIVVRTPVIEPARVVQSEKGIAIWTRSAKGNSRYVLHNHAKLNSEIEIYNPMVRRRIRAKVVGRIPPGTYQDDISIILSPATARSLGALDSRLKVVMTYAE